MTCNTYEVIDEHEIEFQKAKSKIIVGDTPPNIVVCVSAKFNKLQKYLIHKLLGFRVIDIKPSTEEKQSE